MGTHGCEVGYWCKRELEKDKVRKKKSYLEAQLFFPFGEEAREKGGLIFLGLFFLDETSQFNGVPTSLN